jgi:hypothetical protein
MSDSTQTSTCTIVLGRKDQELSENHKSSEPQKIEPRPSQALKHCHEANKVLLSLDESKLLSNIAFRGNHLDELKSSARDLNNGIRDHYGKFIHNVGRNIYPLIVATDYEVDGPCGVGTTLTLYEASGNITQVSPACSTNYELYKTCAHAFMGLSVEIGPYLANAGLCCKGVSSKMQRDVPWKTSLSEFEQNVKMYRNALMRAAELEASMEDSEEKKEGEESKASNVEISCGLPSREMRRVMLLMLSSVGDFCNACLSTGMIDVLAWEQLNRDNFPRIKACMKEATKAQADACVEQIVKWREMLGQDAWRDLYVVIPTVWAVEVENPRKEMFKQLMDPERVDTHLITSEYPRNHSDARTLLGRVVGDRAIGRFVFGVDSLVRK